MGLIPTPAALRAMGVSRVWNGLRTGDQRTLLFGAGMFAVSWLRSHSEPKKKLLYRKTIPAGSSFVIRTGKDGELPEVVVSKADPQPPA